jgi:hypothetical protein
MCIYIQPEDVLLIRISLVGVSPDSFDSNSFARAVKRVLQALGFYPLNVYVYAVFVEDGNTV